MNRLQRAAMRLLGMKDLYALHPELLERVPLLRASSDGEGTVSTQSAQDTFATHVWVHRAVNVVAQTMAPLPVRVVSEDDGQAVGGHPLTALLKGVNDSMSSSDLWRQWLINMQLGGECGLEMVRRANGEPAELWPHSADEIEVRVQRGRSRYGNILGYRITDDQGEPYELAPEEMLHFRFYNPKNRWRGLAPLAAVRTGVLIDQYAQAWQWYFFQNQARPDYVLITPQGLTERERREIETKLTQRFGGVENSHKPIVLEQGVTDVKPLGWAPADAEWAAQREMSRQEIGAVFGVPDEIMGYGKDTYENLQWALTALYQLTVLPLCQMRDETLTNFWQRWGLLKETQRLATDLSGVEVLQADKGPKVEQAKSLFAMGVPMRIINEKLGLDLGEYDGDGIGYLPLSMSPTNYMPGERPEEPEPEPEPAPEPEPVAEPPAPETNEPAAQPVAEQPAPEPAPAPERSVKAVEYGSVLHRQMWLLFKARTEGREGSVKRTVVKGFQAEESALLKVVRAAGAPADLAGKLVDRTKMDAAWRAAMEPIITDVVVAGGEHAIEAAGMTIAFDLLNPLVQQLLKTLIWNFAAEIGDTTQALLESLLSDAIAEGLSIGKTADAIAELYDGFKGQRAERIARTETLKAFNGGAFHGYKQTGAPRKEWISALDDRTRTPDNGSEFDHVAAHGEIVPMNEPFTKTGESIMYPGDPTGSAGNIIQCRCTLAPVWEEG